MVKVTMNEGSHVKLRDCCVYNSKFSLQSELEIRQMDPESRANQGPGNNHKAFNIPVNSLNASNETRAELYFITNKTFI